MALILGDSPSKIEPEFLGSLRFQDMEARRTQVSPAAADTNLWIWSNPDYVSFSDRESGILWIRGKPGSGKSVLAKFIRHSLLQVLKSANLANGSSCLIGDWFYHRRGGDRYTKHLSFLRSILYQFAKQCKEVFSLFCLESYRVMDPENVLWSEVVLRRIILRVCCGSWPVIGIVDAVDEAENAGILPMIREFTEETVDSRAKFIVLSRPAVAIETYTIGISCVVMEDENHRDIEKIVCQGLESLTAALHAFDQTSQTRGRRIRQPRSRSLRLSMDHERLAIEDIQKTIVSNAHGSVLWVKLVIDQLLRQASAPQLCALEDLKQAVIDVPHEMKEYYMLIVTELTAGLEQKDIQEIRNTLMWICAAGEVVDISLDSLWEAKAVIKDDFLSSTMDAISQKKISVKSYGELWRKISLICGPFIEIYNPGFSVEESRNSGYGPTSIIQLMHQSVRDFLTQTSAAGPLYFPIDEARCFVRKHLENYSQITLRYIQNTGLGDGLCCTELVDYLEERKLLRLALGMSQSEFGDTEPLYSLFRIPPLTDPARDTPESLLITVLQHHRHTFEDLPSDYEQAMDMELDTKDSDVNANILLSANRLFFKACSDGLATAVLNMMALKWDRAPQSSASDKSIAFYGIALAASLFQGPRVRVDFTSAGEGKAMPVKPLPMQVRPLPVPPSPLLAVMESTQHLKPATGNQTMDISHSARLFSSMILGESDELSDTTLSSISREPSSSQEKVTVEDPLACSILCLRCTKVGNSKSASRSLAVSNIYTQTVPYLSRVYQILEGHSTCESCRKAPAVCRVKDPSGAAFAVQSPSVRLNYRVQMRRDLEKPSSEEYKRQRDEIWAQLRQKQNDAEEKRENKRREKEQREKEEKRTEQIRKQEEESRLRKDRFESNWVTMRWAVTVAVDTKSGTVTQSAHFKSWSNFLDLLRGPRRHVPMLQRNPTSDDEEEFLEDIENAISTAIQGERSIPGHGHR